MRFRQCSEYFSTNCALGWEGKRSDQNVKTGCKTESRKVGNRQLIKISGNKKELGFSWRGQKGMEI